MKHKFKLLSLLAVGLFSITSCGNKGFYETNFSNVKKVLYYPGMSEDIKNPNHPFQHATPKEMDQMIAKYENEEGFERFFNDERFTELSYCYNCGNSWVGSGLGGTLCNVCNEELKDIEAYYETILLGDWIIFRIYTPKI